MSQHDLSIPPIMATTIDTAAVLDLQPEDIVGASRGKYITLARSAVVWVVRTAHVPFYSRIGNALGNRDRTTVRYLFDKAERLRRHDPEFRDLTDTLLQRAFKRNETRNLEKAA